MICSFCCYLETGRIVFKHNIRNSNLYQNHPSRLMHPNDSRFDSSSAEARVLKNITVHGPIPPIGGTHYHRQRTSPSHYCTRQEARSSLLIRRLLNHVLVVPISGTSPTVKHSSLFSKYVCFKLKNLKLMLNFIHNFII
ncbi:hypothetical protein AVEN_217329-1 [Araneus ventricosus]|uniref:Uncharacterized protein n=1 Tax=Araneus ventricosus TaxID=182803 RepID=A0A4Y2CJG6_ARAVE|nr:hypothetical protein AVEN_217329-1 [Araneus ventricosus]